MYDFHTTTLHDLTKDYVRSKTTRNDNWKLWTLKNEQLSVELDYFNYIPVKTLHERWNDVLCLLGNHHCSLNLAMYISNIE